MYLKLFKNLRFSTGLLAICFAGGVLCSSESVANSEGHRKISCLFAPLQRLAAKALNRHSGPKNWQDLRVTSSSTLPPEYRKTLGQSPIVRELQREHGRGDGLQFFIQDYDSAIEAGKILPMTGESVQALFLKQILSSIFPKARFADGNSLSTKSRALDPKRTAIELRIRDSAEAGHFVDWRKAGSPNAGTNIEMSLLKPANPGPTVAPKANLRNQMNLPANQKIVSLYASVGVRPPELRAALQQLIEKSNTDVVVVSTAWTMEARTYLSKQPNVRVLSSNEITNEITDASVKTVILNETRGRMAAIHRASDATVILGSPNLFESLNVGTPTLFFRTAEEGFNQKTWDTLSDNALATGGAVSVGSMEEVVSRLNSNNLPRPTKRGYESRGEANTLPIDRLLTNIANAMKKE